MSLVLPTPLKPHNDQKRKVHFISDTLGDITLMLRELNRIGAHIETVKAPVSKKVIAYHVFVPKDVHVVVMGDFLNYAKKNVVSENVPDQHKNAVANTKMIKLITGLVQNANVTVLAGTSEVYALGLIGRDDHEMFEPELRVVLDLTDLVSKGKVVHSSVINVARGVEASDSLRKQKPNFEIPQQFIATHAGITFGIWRYLSASVLNVPRYSEPASYIQDPLLISQLLNHDLLLATQAVASLSILPGYGINLVSGKLRLPETVTASKYVHIGEADKLSSPTTADPREIHDSWDNSDLHFLKPGQFRAHSSIDPDDRMDRKFPLDTFRVGNQETKGIVIGQSPCITLHKNDTPNGAGLDFSLVGVVNAPMDERVVANFRRIILEGTAFLADQGVGSRVLSTVHDQGLYRQAPRITGR